MSEKYRLNSVMDCINVAEETIAGWEKDETGRVYVFPDGAAKAVHAAKLQLQALIEGKEPPTEKEKGTE